MLINKLRYFPRILTNKKLFSTLSKQRIQEIRNHSPSTQYKNLNPKIVPHTINTTRLIRDQQTNIRFLVEDGGFPGCSDLGICLKLGTQNQISKTAGSLQYLKNYIHIKPTFQEIVQNYQLLHQTGSSFDFYYDSISSYAKASFFYQDKDTMIDLLLDLALQQKNMIQNEFQTEIDLSNINQLVRRVAFGNKGLGMPSKGIGNILKSQHFLAFQQNITPHNIIISMSNIKNSNEIIQQILRRIKQRYPKFLSRNPPLQVKSKYVGGMQSFESDQQFFEFALAYPGSALKSQQMELFHILRVLLGNASSFSSGGPGKGMHSRCTRLMNTIACVQKCSAINEQYDTHGLFGLTVGGPHNSVQDVVKCTINQFHKLHYLIPETQLQRSKNILIASIYSNIERQADRLEQITKHIFYYNKVRLYDFERKIRNITNHDIKRVMQRMFSERPTFVFSGNQQSLQRKYKYEQLALSLRNS